MNENIPLNHPHHHHCAVDSYKRISWTAIIVGALVAVGLGFLLHLFTIAIGLSAVSWDKEGSSALAIGGLIGIIIAIIPAMLAAGYAAGYLGRRYCPERNMGILYGFATWSLSLLLMAILATPLSHYVSAYSDVVVGSSLAEIQNTAYRHGATDTPAVRGDRTTTASDTDTDRNNRRVAADKAPVTAETLASAGFILFVLFFIGALATCFGAYWGMMCKRED